MRRLEAYDGVTMFFIAEKQQKIILYFYNRTSKKKLLNEANLWQENEKLSTITQNKIMMHEMKISIIQNF